MTNEFAEISTYTELHDQIQKRLEIWPKKRIRICMDCNLEKNKSSQVVSVIRRHFSVQELPNYEF